MKTTPFFVYLVSTGVLLAASPAPVRAQALRTESSGTGNLLEDSLLNLGGPRLIGVLPPARLGSGTPSSTKFLRGDGSWAGMTPGGNTIPSASGLLMGDGSGNAAAVASSTDLTRLLDARLELVRAAPVLPTNLLTSAALTQGTVNPDGTLTVPAGGFVAWNLTGTGGQVYLYAAATSDQSADVLKIEAFYAASNRTDSSSNPLPGVARSVTVSLSAGAPYQVRVTNTTASPVTIFYPAATTADNGLILVISQADFTPVAPPPLSDLDFAPAAAAGGRTGRYFTERQTTLAADSVGGSNAGAGTLYSPKLTLQQTLANGSVFGLYRGSVFRESLPLSGLGGAHGIVVQDVARGSQKPLPVVSALDGLDSSGVVGLGGGVFSYLWTPVDGAVSNDGYANVYLVEINTATEAAQPLASRRRLTDVTGLAAVQAAVGTAWVQSPGTGTGQSGSSTQWKVVFHATDGSLPGSGGYRYEVVSRVAPTNWYPGNVFGDGSLSGLQLVGSSGGYGPLSGPTGFVGDRLVIAHCTTHGAVLGGGSLQRSVFYEMGDEDSIQLAWYAANPAGLSWQTRACLFYARNAGTSRTPAFLISHSGNGQSYARGDIADCAFVGGRLADGSLAGVAIDYVNVAAGVIERSYVQGVRTLFGTAMPVSAEVRNNVFRQVQTCNVGENFHDNLVLAEPAGVNYATASPCSFSAAGASATNNLFWAHGITNGFPYNDGANGINIQGTNCTCSRNIFVLDPASTTARSAYFYHGSTDVATLAVDYNLVLNLGKAGIDSQGNHFSWAEHRATYPTIDVHSLYVDLSGDPRGLRAIFADPDHGDFRWAQTEVARRCAAYCRTNNVGPATVTSHWPVVPAVDEAVRALTSL